MLTLNEMNTVHMSVIEESNAIIAMLEKQLAETDELLEGLGVDLNEEV